MRSRDQTLMSVAVVYETRSTCSRNHVGAVIAIDGRVVGTGYNGAPAGMPHCDHRCVCPQPNILDVGFEDDQHLDECLFDKPCRIAVHAEANTIAFCAKHGLRTEGATLYTTLSPCYGCAQLIINAGIVRVVYLRAYRVDEGIHLMRSAGLTVDRL